MALNVRRDDTFVRDSDWNAAAKRYEAFCKAHETGRVVYLELGAEPDAPDIARLPFTQHAHKNPEAFHICVNAERQRVPAEIAGRSVMIGRDSGTALKQFLSAINQ